MANGEKEQDWVGISLEMGERGEDMVAWMERQQFFFSVELFSCEAVGSSFSEDFFTLLIQSRTTRDG